MKIPLSEAKFGDVLLFRPTSAFGDQIVAVDGGPYSHGALYHVKLDGRHTFTEALPFGGIVFSVLDEALLVDGVQNFDVYRPPFPIVRTPEEVMARVGRVRYDFWRIVRLLLNRTLRVPMPRKGNPNADVCTEHLGWAYGGAFGAFPTPRTVYEAVK